MALAIICGVNDVLLALNTEKQRIPWWMYPNLLSLDAPLVAVTWMFVFKNVWDVNYIESWAVVVLALIVWAIYASDRLLDQYLHKEHNDSPRHQFHKRHQRYFKIGIYAALVCSLILSLFFLQWSIILSAIAPAVAASGFFLMSIFSPPKQGISYTKNLLAGFAFAWGVGAGLIGLIPQLHFMQMLFSAEMLCFGMLCVINITAVDLWMKKSGDADPDIDEWALTLPLTILAGFAILYMRFRSHELSKPFYEATLVAAGLMYVLNRIRHKFSPDLMRVLADVVLLFAAFVYWTIS